MQREKSLDFRDWKNAANWMKMKGNVTKEVTARRVLIIQH